MKLVKWLMFLGVFFAAVLWLSPRLLGFSPLHLGQAVAVATHMSAKLACSARFISGYDETRIRNDLASYSPVYRQVHLVYDETAKTVSSDLFGLAQVQARYRPATGCAVDFTGVTALESLTAAPIQADSAQSWPVGENTPAIQPALQQLTDQLLAQDNQQGLETRALLVVQHGQLVAESYAPGVTAQTPLLGWSMAKSVNAMLIGRLMQTGQLPLDQTHLFPAWQQDSRADISLRHMLQMSSGLDFDETYSPGSDSTRMLFTEPSTAAVALESLPLYAPGQQFSYSSGTANLLSHFLGLQLGSKPQARLDFVWQQLFAPLAMQHSIFEMDPSGDFVGSSYLYASARDWGRLGLLMLQQGQWQGQQLLAPAFMAEAVLPNHSLNEKAYGFQFWLNQGDAALRWPPLPADAYAMNGNRQQTVMVIPSRDVVLVRLGWSAGDYPMPAHFAKLLQQLD